MTGAPNLHIGILIIGFFTGILSGTLGIGGGIFCTPMLRLVLGVAPHTAVGTTMVLIIPTTMFGAFGYWRKKLVDLKIVKMLALPASIGCICGAVAINYIQPSVLMVLFALFTGVAGLDVSLGIGSQIKSARRSIVSAHGPAHKTVSVFAAIVIGFFVGFCAGFFGVGGGFILVPILLYLFHCSIKMAFGTSLVIIAALAFPGAVTHALEHHVDYSVAFFLLLGAVPGSWLGSLLAFRLSETSLKRAFGVLLLAMALILAFKEIETFGHVEGREGSGKYFPSEAH